MASPSADPLKPNSISQVPVALTACLPGYLAAYLTADLPIDLLGDYANANSGPNRESGLPSYSETSILVGKFDDLVTGPSQA